MSVPTIAVKESRADLLEIGPSTGLPGGVYGLVYALEKGLYVWKTGDQSSNVPSNNDSDEWIAPSEDTSGKSGAWKRIVKERPEMSVIYHPEEATDAGTDQYGSEETTDPPSDDAVIARDFQSANTTTTPTLDSKTITNRDGNALWAGAINGVHELQYASGTDTYLLLDPMPLDGNQPASVTYVDAGDPTLDTVVDATNGGSNDLTEIDFTGIKSGAQRIVVLLSSVSLSGTDHILVQIGDSGGFETSGYESFGGSYFETDSVAIATSSSGYVIQVQNAGSRVFARIVIERFNDNQWIASYVGGRTSAIAINGGGGTTLSDILDRVRITTSGTDTFDNGNVNIVVE